MEYRKSSHTCYNIKYHIIWCTKYRYQVLEKSIQMRLREIIRQTCEKNGIQIIKGNIGKDHVHILISSPPQHSVSKIVQMIKGRSSHIIQDEFPHLKKRYWGQHMWARGYFCGTVGTVDEETIKNYIETQDKLDTNYNFRIQD